MAFLELFTQDGVWTLRQSRPLEVLKAADGDSVKNKREGVRLTNIQTTKKTRIYKCSSSCSRVHAEIWTKTSLKHHQIFNCISLESLWKNSKHRMQILFAQDNKETHSEREDLQGSASGSPRWFVWFSPAIPSVLRLSLESADNATRLKIADR